MSLRPGPAGGKPPHRARAGSAGRARRPAAAQEAARRGAAHVRRDRAETFHPGGALMANTVLVAEADGIATLTLNRPEKRNAISFELLEDLMSALDAAEKAAAQVVILTGAGQAFCAGLDLENLKGLLGKKHEENVKDSATMARL